MAILHQVALGAQRIDAWTSLRTACAAGDTVVLMDAAVASGPLFAAAWAQSGVRVCVAAAGDERAALPGTIELIDDHQWWQLIVEHELIQHWM